MFSLFAATGSSQALSRLNKTLCVAYAWNWLEIQNSRGLEPFGAMRTFSVYFVNVFKVLCFRNCRHLVLRADCRFVNFDDRRRE